jgi:hypothetical protein
LPVYFDYPLSYMRMAIEYNCSDCNVCSPSAIMNAFKENNASFLVPIDQWVECSGFGMDTSPSYPCNAAQSYHGRCNLYPTFDISMSSRLTHVIDTLESMNSSLNITTRTATGQNGIDMHANVLYYNQSKVSSLSSPSAVISVHKRVLSFSSTLYHSWIETLMISSSVKSS